MGVRRLWALVNGLPAEAAIWRGDRPKWTLENELAAGQIEATTSWLRVIAQLLGAQFKPRPKLPEPALVDHPHRPRPERPARRASGPGEIKQFFGRFFGGPSEGGEQ